VQNILYQNLTVSMTLPCNSLKLSVGGTSSVSSK
jgi:hypothetical protein